MALPFASALVAFRPEARKRLNEKIQSIQLHEKFKDYHKLFQLRMQIFYMT